MNSLPPSSSAMSPIFIPVPGLPEVVAGTNLADLIGGALVDANLPPEAGDVIVIAQKVVSKAEDRFVDLETIVPSPEARELATVTQKDARLVELILRESQEVIRAKPGVLIAAHRSGFVMAQAGIDRSNVGDPAADRVLLLPEDCDAAAEELYEALKRRFGVDIGVIVSDSFGRPWRKGTVNVALGVAGLPALIDRRGDLDRYGRRLDHTEIAFADCIAAGAGLAMGEAAEGMPLVLVRGLRWDAPASNGQALLRPKSEDMFR